MIIYIDLDFKCHTEMAENYRAIETDFFDNKCKEYIEGHRYVPSDETWVRQDGVKFAGEMIAPCINYDQLLHAQLQYELEDVESALAILGVNNE